MVKEKRQFDRYQANHKVIVSDEKNITHDANTYDISQGGVGVYVSEKIDEIDVGNVFKVSIKLDSDGDSGIFLGDGAEVSASAEVRYVLMNDEQDRLKIGFSFVDFEGKSKDMLHRYLADYVAR